VGIKDVSSIYEKGIMDSLKDEHINCRELASINY